MFELKILGAGGGGGRSERAPSEIRFPFSRNSTATVANWKTIRCVMVVRPCTKISATTSFLRVAGIRCHCRPLAGARWCIDYTLHDSVTSCFPLCSFPASTSPRPHEFSSRFCPLFFFFFGRFSWLFFPRPGVVVVRKLVFSVAFFVECRAPAGKVQNRLLGAKTMPRYSPGNFISRYRFNLHDVPPLLRKWRTQFWVRARRTSPK